jgi:hypothetical protein
MKGLLVPNTQIDTGIVFLDSAYEGEQMVFVFLSPVYFT